jgi:hypothetical protein
VNLLAYLDYEMDRFQIEEKMRAGITTDNGSDIKCAASIGRFGPRIYCAAHGINLVLKYGLALFEDPNPKR